MNTENKRRVTWGIESRDVVVAGEVIVFVGGFIFGILVTMILTILFDGGC